MSALAISGMVYLTLVRRRPELVGFVMLGAAVVVASAMLTYAAPGPLMPILETWWRSFHVTIIVTSAGVFTVGFLFNGLHLLRDTAERGLDEARATRGGTPLPAGGAGDDPDGRLATLGAEDVVAGRVVPDEDHDGVALPSRPNAARCVPPSRR